MNRIFYLLAILQFSNIAFSQPYGGLLSGISQNPAYEFRENAFSWITENGVSTYILTPQKFNTLLSDPNILRKLEKETYSFFNEGRFYMLSYDQDTQNIPDLKWHDNMRIERGLFLFCLDESGWVRACDKPLQIDFKEIRDHKYYYSAYFPWRYDTDLKMKGEVERLPSGDVHVRIINHKMTDYSNPKESILYFYHDVVLIPKGVGTYDVQE